MRIANRDNVRDKDKKGRFLEKGEIVEKCTNRSFIVRFENEKLKKRNVSDLKKI